MWSRGCGYRLSLLSRRQQLKEICCSNGNRRQHHHQLRQQHRWLSSTSSAAAALEEPRESMPYDVLIVGGGPAGLAASIRLKQLCQQHGKELSVCLIDKGSEIGAHILSGNVFDPKAMHELFPEMSNPKDKKQYWTHQFQQEQGSFATPVQEDKMLVLTNASNSFQLPHFLLPPQLHNHGNYVISLSQLCRWLAKRAEDMGVEIYPGFSASEVVFWEDDNKKEGGNQSVVKGVATRDVGIGKHGEVKPTFARGVELQARQTIFAEGARGSCSEFLMHHYQLRQNCHPQTYGLGLKEVWQVPPEIFQPGLVQHSLGFPLQSGFTDRLFGGSFLYHQEPNYVLIGLVVGLDYVNPYINPYQEFQRWKTHPEIRKHLDGGTCISYGARVLNEGGLHAIPKCTFPGGVLIGCSAGFLNAVKIKGSHTAMKSGMLAAESIFDALTTTADADNSIPSVAETGELPEPQPHTAEVSQYAQALSQSWIYDELHQVRNSHEAFARWGVGGGVMYTGLTTHITKGREPWTLHHTAASDAERTQLAKGFQPISYPPPDGKLTFDLLTNLQRSGTYHEEDQPAHLRIKPELASVPEKVSLQEYGAPESRFCPAGVYEYIEQEQADNNSASSTGKAEKKLVINAQNCIHCKCCSIKCPKEYIQWTVPEGGGGPQYQVM